MKVLLTGAAGYIGSHMCRMFVEKGVSCVVLDTMEFGHKQALPSQAELVVGNVADKQLLTTLFEKHSFDAVIHFAGYISVEESVRMPIKYMQNNLTGPMELLEAMRAHSVTRILFSSTAAVYGNPVKNPIPEDHPKNPLSPYGLSKWAFEELLHVYERSYGFKAICLRYFNACGASLDGKYGEMHDPETHLISLAIKAALKMRDSFSLYGTDYNTPDGTAVRDFIHVEDLCHAHELALDALLNGHKSDIFNVGTGIGVSVQQVIQTIQDVVSPDIVIKKADRRAGDASELIADSSRIQKYLGWKPVHSDIETIIKSAYAWHKNNPNGYV